MNNRIAKVVGISTVAVAGMRLAGAQGLTWDSVCIDPKNTAPYSVPFGTNSAFNDLMSCTVGAIGTVTYGGAMGPCFVPAKTINVRGRFGFSVGPIGSSQSSFDDFMQLTFGMPISPGGSWNDAELITDGAQTLVGANALVTTFKGASDNYVYLETINGKVRIQLRTDVIGDATRASWNLINQDTTSHSLGLWYGNAMAMLAQSPDPTTGVQGSGAFTGVRSKPAFVEIPGIRPPSTEHRFIQSQDPSGFPPFVDYCFGQDKAYGLRIDNGPTAATEDATGTNSDATQADEFALGQEFFLFGGDTGGDGAMADVMFGPNNTGGDVTFGDNPGYIQKFYGVLIPAGGTRTIVQYFHSTWGLSNYSKPYSAVVDAPNLIASNTAGQNGLDQDPNSPRFMRVYIDNTRGFSTIDQSIEIDNVQITAKFQQGTGIQFSPNEQQRVVVEQVNGQPVNFVEVTKTIPVIKPANIGHEDFNIVANGIGYGAIPYIVTVSPTPGPAKTLNGVINVSTTPRLTINAGANLVSSPYVFSDTSLEAIFKLKIPGDFQAFTWDAVNKGYVQATSMPRGHALWIVSPTNRGSLQLNGNPTVPIDDINNGAPLITLKSGWNLIGNPYNYAFPLGQIIAARGNPNGSTSYKWDDLVNQGSVSGSLAFVDAVNGGYSYLSGDSTMVEPNVGYWIYLYDLQDLTLEYPPVFAPFLPGATRGTDGWSPGPRDWRLNLTVHDQSSMDSKNYIGSVADPKVAKAQTIMKPPMMPNQNLTMAVQGELKGVKTRMAQSLTTGGGKQQYSISVDSVKGGQTTITWPTMMSVPKNMGFRIVDLSTNSSRDMRQISGYTFTAAANSHRDFRIEVTPSAGSHPSIGNVSVNQSGRDVHGPFTVSYTLSDSAQTTVRILSSRGREVRVPTRGRADGAGLNTIVWDLKDEANRAVAPGIYRVEITAEVNGEQVRRIVSLNVRG